MHPQGMSSRVSPLTVDLLAQDSKPLPPGLKMTGNHQPEARTIPFSRYTDPAFAKLEMERLWLRTWQVTCRTEDIPNIGDRVPYDVGTGLSLVIVRSGANEFKAFYNACRHRGTRLVNAPGGGDTIRCPFHGWQWKPDGALKEVPCQWDFNGISGGSHDLKEVQVAVWEGFIFVNPDPDAAPLKDALGVLPQAFEGRGHAERYTFAHVSKKIRANWKTVLEAFLEAYHVIETHNDAMPFTGDANTSYDIWDTGAGHISRLITPSAVPSPHLGDDASTQIAADGVAAFFAMAMPGVPMPALDASKGNARAQLAEWRRGLMKMGLGLDMSNHCDSELIDSTQFHMFPNFGVWYGDGLPLLYQFLPHGDNPNESVFNVRLTMPLPANGVRPPAAKINHLDFDEYFSDKAPEFGPLSHIFDQDLSNLPYIQQGMHSAAPGAAHQTLGTYMEQRIQYFQNVLADKLGVN
ncbi:aromatic ring-hydroxylating dioxygenase subunit alpha (plasmid) [Diaphorobacter sp. HDW4B]|uniref:aromatic ring-hydroxylating oxygenase subunit alpha n=1 Tax=Diaphorobacter sp. HDW4B TaxID=2714925 RepID=UPI00140AF5A8|nr:aromatic ring-hydroxylating dioxygenase subunit alpha [Diaphorobacter sp. HDW4B]QIL74011.1 aromatic ring-hydroxylating dioxygenase subunit alpha [Diaphorobacter sp. HDW4B]